MSEFCALLFYSIKGPIFLGNNSAFGWWFGQIIPAGWLLPDLCNFSVVFVYLFQKIGSVPASVCLWYQLSLFGVTLRWAMWVFLEILGSWAILLNFGINSDFGVAGSSKGFKHGSNANIEVWSKLKMTQIWGVVSLMISLSSPCCLL